ncbi:hypothetical protein PRIPAC_82851 [Pristionchus pacificus]|uniref:Ion channel n=1 Tax=Pristionchus pacificus TaxID=54126 RepID=A0A2A6C3P5_PRIPA|nr:hypothetical protein PRIPAC_82851 [Pristionchus pacificus]|eukprot:PDM72750.1 ion channel [Pristionchus pacificus]
MCTCSANYTGDTCGIQTKSNQTMDTWLGPPDSAKMIGIVSIAQSSPAALVSAMPSIYASIPAETKANMSWTQEEMIDSVDFEMSPVDVNTAFTPIVDEQLGNCFTFNYANKTNQGQFKARLAGQQRALTVTLKLHPAEQVAWIDSAAISTYIHAPGTPPSQGVLYSVKGGTVVLIGLHKTITKLKYGCLKSRDELKGNYYEDGDYTRDVGVVRWTKESEIVQGCLSACYQDKVFAKCGCMDASFKKAASASQCLFKDSDCVSAISAQYGDPSSWSTCKCMPECYQETYTLVSTRAALPFKLPKCTNVTDGCPDDVIESVSRLTIYVESLESEVYVEVEKLPFISMLSQVGGQLGFLFGMSIVGILEIVILCATIGKNQCAHTSK